MREETRSPEMVSKALASAAKLGFKAAPRGEKQGVAEALNKANRKAQRAPLDEPFLPRDRETAIIQAGMDMRLAHPDAATLGDDILFSKADLGWAVVVAALIQKLLTPDAPFIKHTALTDFNFTMRTKATMSLFSDWGTGRPAAEAVARQITNLQPEYMIHLGDIYYAGFESEVDDRFLNRLPTSANLKRRFALNANHEMYSGGHGYFEKVLPAFDQPASYFCISNDHWRIIGLDSAYKDGDLKDPQVKWLTAQLAEDGKKNILLTHHQGFSIFEDVKQGLPNKLAPLLDAGKIHAWFWGHEHNHIVYLKNRNTLARCIGHGAIPYPPPAKIFVHPEAKVQFVNRRIRADSLQAVNGFAHLEFDGPRLHVNYVDEDGKIQFAEDLDFEIRSQLGR